MSSNIRIERICQCCTRVFIARTTATRFCSHACARRAYKQKKRADKIEASHSETSKVLSKPFDDLKAKEFLTVREVARLLACSIRSAYSFIHSGNIKAVNLGERITRVKRTEIDKVFEQATKAAAGATEKADVSDYYSTEEVRKKFGISESCLRSLIIKHKVPKFRKGWYAYVPKNIIDNILSS